MQRPHRGMHCMALFSGSAGLISPMQRPLCGMHGMGFSVGLWFMSGQA